ncbi:MAG: ATP-binding protein [Chitinophagales bacterium]|nr:ATP-binding protein [Chitinophagales bacterium]
MLLQFSIKNFRTFKDKATLSLIASNYDKDTREYENIVMNDSFGLRLLKSAVIYGANASGKSKLLDAFAFMRYFVINSSKESQKGEAIKIEPFKLDQSSKTESTEFEVIFIHNQVLFRYGFEVTKESIISEWLFYKPKTKEVELFYREGNEYKIHNRNFSKGDTVAKEGLVRDNALLISVAAQFNEKSAIEVLEWFEKNRVISGLYDAEYRDNTVNKISDKSYKNRVLRFLKAADIGIEDLEILTIHSGQSKESPFNTVLIIKNIYEDKIKIGTTPFFLSLDESEGTRKYFYILGPVIDALEYGGILMVDELDSKLHPNLVCKIVSLFNSKEFNKKNAQLIFNTHDTNLLSSGLFRRDQIWFTNKNKYGEAQLYSLADFKSDEVRKNDPFEDNYIKGKYGAVPFLGFFDNLKFLLTENENERQKS